MEAVQMAQTKTRSLAEPRIESRGRLCIAGISRHYPFESVAQIPDQWQSFVPLMTRISGEDSAPTYGVIYNGTDESFDYLSGVERSTDGDAPDGLVRLDLAPQTYLVFTHGDHVATLRETCEAIWTEWLPSSNHVALEAPWFERYGDSFDPETGAGGLEVWIPVAG
jgi:AraC family transcriptional regulator